MGLFGNSTADYASDIEKATSEKNTAEKWGVIMDICDKVGTNPVNGKECLKIVVKRLNHNDPHVVMQAITLLDALINNCGKNFHLEIASREFETEFKKLIAKSQPQIVTRLKTCLKKWAEGDFKKDPQLNLIPSLYQKLKTDGHDFVDYDKTDAANVKREVVLSKDPNVVSSQQEEDDIAKAIELSLKENKTTSPKLVSSSNTIGTNSSVAQSASLYPSVSLNTYGTPGVAAAAPATEPRKVRALYDFEAAEENELTFFTDEIIVVTEDSDPNWWKGTNHRGEGLFPANFVTDDLSVDPDYESKNKKTVQFDEQSQLDQSQSLSNESQKIIEINENNIDRLLALLHDADPEDPSQDTDEMLQLENEVNQMGPLIDTELERVDRKHAQLTQLSGDLVDAINLYHTLMRQPEVIGGGPMMMPGGFGGLPQSMPPNMYQNMPPNMYQMPNAMMQHPQHPQQQQQHSSISSPQHQPPQQSQQPPPHGMHLPNFQMNNMMPPQGVNGPIPINLQNGQHNMAQPNMNPVPNMQQHLQHPQQQQPQQQQPQQQQPQQPQPPQQQPQPLQQLPPMMLQRGMLPEQMQSHQPGLPQMNNFMPNPNMQQQLQNPNFPPPNQIINNIPPSATQVPNIPMHHQLQQQQQHFTVANSIMGMPPNTQLHQSPQQPSQHPLLQTNSNQNIPIYQQQR